MATDGDNVSQAAPPPAPQLPRQQLVDLITQLLTRKAGAVAEIQRRINADQGLEVRGMKVETSVLKDALAKHEASCGAVHGQLAESCVAANSLAASTYTAPAAVPPCASGLQVAPAASDHTSLPDDGGLRWCPQVPSATALASRAISECESAEPFVRKITVTGANKIAVLPKASVSSAPTGEYLHAGEKADVIARCVSQKDGRVYLRLRRLCGWISTRSRKDFWRVIVAAADKDDAPIEPPDFAASVACSYAAKQLPHVDFHGNPTAVVSFNDAACPDASAPSEWSPKSFSCVSARGSQILSAPSLENGTSTAGALMRTREEFVADKVHVSQADGRTYLRLQDGRGWVSERHRQDFSKVVIMPAGLTLCPVNRGCEQTHEQDKELESATPPSKTLKRADGARKVFIVERDPVVADGHGDMIKEIFVESGDSPCVPAQPIMSIFRSDEELWPESLRPPRPLLSTTRVQMRRLYCFYASRWRDCEADIREAILRAENFGRSCPTEKALRQHADALDGEARNIKEQWCEAVKEVLKGDSADKAAPPTEANVSSFTVSQQGGFVAPIQVNGLRWYCASVRAAMIAVDDISAITSPEKPKGRGSVRNAADGSSPSPEKIKGKARRPAIKEAGGEAAETETVPEKADRGRQKPTLYHLGPLRAKREEAADDLNRMLGHLGQKAGPVAAAALSVSRDIPLEKESRTPDAKRRRLHKINSDPAMEAVAAGA